MKSADRPGRYGAILEAKTAAGYVTRRFVTLCRVPQTLGSWQLQRDGLAALSSAIASDSKLLSRIDESWPLHSANPLQNQQFAWIAANLCSGDDGTPFEADEHWWAGIRRKFYGYDTAFPSLKGSFTPAPVNPPAITLRLGTPQEAGMEPYAVARVDSLCRAGVRQYPSEPLSFCFARHGVVFYHRAYGTFKDGTAMTVDTPGELASITKSFVGTMAMMVAQRGVIDLDKPLGAYIPSFANRPGGDRITMHMLLSHMSDLPLGSGHIADLEEVAADYMPLVTPMTPRYSEVNFNLAGDILEDLTGEDLAHLFQDMLFKPLGISSANGFLGFSGVFMRPWDLAVYGQMLLNRGSYGGSQFLTPENFNRMLPSPDWGPRGGIGLVPLGNGGLPPKTFGYTTNSSAVFRVVPEDDMVIVICSTTPLQYSFRTKVEPKLFKTLIAGVMN